ncbi:hypothetical protein HDF26_005305 [Pedobacter cryoconitis]|uniref:DUF4783 domain-containing protein n=1 Tax=Pedobacter cryoconitis TaxID=188932 RepID=A0A7W8ZSG0_9SPHI|nr:DUF4783 domain-containing protein [Pedobacter cryoconitis]MBB5639208.1 hypothetical protein [Pedobacter cryoconitis]MBB6274819.1 hypothetical protein [Pedobacter cryoconitis]
MIRPLLSVLIFFTQLFNPGLFQGDIVDSLSTLFKAGNSKEISKNFSPSVELTINEEEDVYTKAQAEQIVREFFTKNAPVNSTVVHLINTNPNYRFGILSLSTKNGKFRVAITLKKTANTFFITELRIEPDK